MLSLGVIETKGLLAAIEAADAMLKAANVRLLGKHLVSGGLVSITICGEVSAVKASVDAGTAAVRNIRNDLFVSELVIARPDEELAKIIPLVPMVATNKPASSARNNVVEKTEVHSEKSSAPKAKPQKSEVKSEVSIPAESQLKKMNVNNLRQLARNLKNFSMTREEIKFASKQDLINAIIKHTGS